MPHHPAHEHSAPLPAARPAASSVELRQGQTVVFFGDSITAAQPGYIEVLDQVLNGGPLRLGLRLINEGVSGDTVRDLLYRLPAALAHKPDWVFVLVGTNDLFGAETGSPVGVPLDEFEQSLDRLVQQIESAGAKVVLMTLTMVAEEMDEAAAALLKPYNGAIKRVAEAHNTRLVDLGNAFRNIYDRAATYKQQVTLTTDGVHPDAKGHALIARTIIADLGLLKKT